MDATDEARLLAAGKAGRVLDLGADGRRGSVDASSLRRCCHELKDQIDPRGIRLRNAMIVGLVGLAAWTCHSRCGSRTANSTRRS